MLLNQFLFSDLQKEIKNFAIDLEWTLSDLFETQEIEMSKQFPECPLCNHFNCKEIYIKKVCAIVRNYNSQKFNIYKN